MKKLIIWFIIWDLINQFECCISFYCINSCGSSKNGINKGYKLILANNRDEDINRLTISAAPWLSKYVNSHSRDFIYLPCNQSKLSDDLCVYGPLDLARGEPPHYYSTWLAINERGSIGNLLFYMQPSAHIEERRKRGIIAGLYLRNSTWKNVDEFLQYLIDIKSDFKPFNYVHLEMSKLNGKYSIFYLNNNNSKTFSKINPDDSDNFIFALSNSDSKEPFNKVNQGKEKFKQIIDDYSHSSDKKSLVDAIYKDLLFDKNPNYPDEILKKYMNVLDEKDVKGISRINADYGNYWKNAYSRTSTLILVDYDDNVEYYEYNMTKWDEFESKWDMINFTFKLNPLYKNNFNNNHFSFKVFSVLITSFLFKYFY